MIGARAELFTALQPIEPSINDNFTSSLNGQNNGKTYFSASKVIFYKKFWNLVFYRCLL